MPAERQQRATFEDRLRVLGRLTEAVHAHAGWQPLALARGNLHVTMGNGTGGQVKDNRITVGPRRRKGDRVGAKQRSVGAMRDDASHAVDHTERYQPLISERLDVRPQRGEMVGIADRQYRDAGTAGFFHQQGPCGGEGRLREAVVGVDPDKPRSHILDHRYGLAVYPTALQRRDVSRHPEHPMTVRAVALGARAVFSQHPSDLGRGAMMLEYLLKQRCQLIEGQVLRDNSRHLIVWRRHLKLQTNFWRGQQRI